MKHSSSEPCLLWFGEDADVYHESFIGFFESEEVETQDFLVPTESQDTLIQTFQELSDFLQETLPEGKTQEESSEQSLLSWCQHLAEAKLAPKAYMALVLWTNSVQVDWLMRLAQHLKAHHTKYPKVRLLVFSNDSPEVIENNGFSKFFHEEEIRGGIIQALKYQLHTVNRNASTQIRSLYLDLFNSIEKKDIAAMEVSGANIFKAAQEQSLNTIIISTHHLLSMGYLSFQNLDKAVIENQKAEELCGIELSSDKENLEVKTLLAQVFFLRGGLFFSQKNLEASSKAYEEAARLSLQVENHFMVHMAYRAQYPVESELKRWEKSWEAGMNSLNSLKLVGSAERQGLRLKELGQDIQKVIEHWQPEMDSYKLRLDAALVDLGVN